MVAAQFIRSTVAKLLLVEDDRNLADSVAKYLRAENHNVEYAANGSEATTLLAISDFEVIVLDLGLPDMDGIEVMRAYRSKNGQGKILLLTGRDKIEDKERGLDAGADDYLTKPFNVKELAARVRALLRRPVGVQTDVLRVASLELNSKTFKLKKGDENISLTKREFAFLEFLMRYPDQVFSSESILARVWESESEASIDTVKVFVNRLRGKLGTDCAASIKTVHGVGYKLEVTAIPE